MSYAAHKSRMFRDSNDVPEVVRKRSEGRMKTYPSATDARAWCVDTDDRRQHILDLIRADQEKCALGKYVPIEVLIDTLLANKNADIAKLREQVEELQRLLDMYSKLDLTEDQKRMLAGMQREMDKAGGELDDLAERSGSKTKSPRDGELGLGAEAGEYETETEGETGDTGESDLGGAALESGEEGEFETEEGDFSTEEGGGAEKIGGKDDEAPTCSALSRPPCSAMAKAGEQPADTAGAPASYDGYSEKDLKDLLISKDAEIISLKNAVAAKTAECDQQNTIARSAIEQLETLKDIMEERDTLKQQLEESLHELQTLRSRVEDPCVAEIAALETEIDRLRSSGQLSPDEEAEVIRKEVDVLKKYCAKLSSIQEENNRLKTQIERLQELSGIPAQPEDDSDIPTDPGELKNRFKDLRRKFAKLSEIIEERDKFKIRVQQLESELLKYGDLPEEIEIFRQRSQMLDDVLDERNNLQQRLERLKGIEDELIILKRKADRVDELESQLDSMNGEVGKIRRSSALESQSLKSQNDDANRELENIKAERDMLRMKAADMATVDEELERLRYRAKEAEVLRIERDRMKVRLDELAAIEVEYMQLLDKTRCIETIKAEREMYKQKYEELLGLECECDMLRAQVERFKQLDKEREALLRQVRDCECCIADQEDEIKRLVSHIDRMSQGSNQQQDRMQKALTDIRAELEQKNSLIATSEEQLAGVQDQLKCTIAGVSCETTCLRARIEELESELEEVNTKLKEKQDEVNLLNGSLSAERQSSAEQIAQLQKDLEEGRSENERLQNMASQGASFEGDVHLENMLRQSKCAVKRVAEELGKHYQEWDCMQGRISEEDMNYQVQAQDEDRDDLFAKYSQEKRTSMKLSNDVDELQAKVRQLEEELARANETIAKLRDGLTGVDRLSAENKALRRHSTEVQDVAKEQIEELVEHLKKAKERIAELEAQNAALLAASKGEAPPVVMTSGDNCDELKQQIEHLQSENDKLDKLVQQFQQDQAAGGPDIGALRMDLANMEEQLQKEIKLRQAAEERIANLNNQLNSMTDTIQDKVRRSSIAETELEAELLKLRAENAQLRDNMKSMGDSANRRTSQVEGEVEVLAEQNKQLLKEKLALESENASLKQQLEDLRNASGDAAEMDALRKEKEALLLQIEEQKKEINDMIQKLNVPSAAASTTAGDLNQAELEKERKEKEDLQNMIKSLQDQINSMGQGAVALPVSSAAAASDTSALNDVIAKLTAQLEQEQAKAQAAEQALKQLQAETGSVFGAVDDSLVRDELEMLRNKVNELQVQNDQLALAAAGDDTVLLNQINDLNQKIKDLEMENLELKGKLSRMQSEVTGLKRMSEDMESDHTAQIKRVSKSYEQRLEKSNASIKMLEQAMNLSAEDQAVLDKMKAAYEDHIRALEDELAMQKQECASLQAKYDRDVKNINNKYNDGVAKLQGSHEEILKDVSKEYEKEVEGLRKELRSSKETIETLEIEKAKYEYSKSMSVTGTAGGKGSLTVKTVENVNIKPTAKASADTITKPPAGRGICTCGSGLENILHKILKDGLESLTFEELQFLHTKTCDATANVLGKRSDGGSNRLPVPRVSMPMPVPMEMPPPRDIDKLSLMRRISGLEGDLMRKQKHAQQKVGALQIAVRMERQRLEELKNTLDVEKQRNCELMCKIGAQSRAVANMQVEREIMRKQSSFHEEKLQELMMNCEDEKSRVKNLEDDLHKAKQKQRRDSEALESMRIKLEKSLNNEMVLKMQLDQRTQGRSQAPAVPCTCHRPEPQDSSSSGQPHQSRTSSFYTELTLQDIRKKRNFVHHCCMKQRDQPGTSSDRSKRSSSARPSSRKTSDAD